MNHSIDKRSFFSKRNRLSLRRKDTTHVVDLNTQEPVPVVQKDIEINKPSMLLSYLQKEMIPSAQPIQKIAPTPVDDTKVSFLKDVFDKMEYDRDSFDITIRDTKSKLMSYKKDINDTFSRFQDLIKELDNEMHSYANEGKSKLTHIFGMDQFKLSLVNKLTIAYHHCTGDLHKMRTSIGIEMMQFQDSFNLLEFKCRSSNDFMSMDMSTGWTQSAKDLYQEKNYKMNQSIVSLNTSVMNLMNEDMADTLRLLEDCIQKISTLKSKTSTSYLTYKAPAAQALGVPSMSPAITANVIPLKPKEQQKPQQITIQNG